MQRTPFPLPVYPPVQKQIGKPKQSNKFSQTLSNNFWNFSVDQASRLLEKKEPEYWEHEGEKLALETFHAAAKRVPAYKDFLTKNKINHKLVKSLNDFKKVPWIDKKNYLNQYTLPELSWDGVLSRNHMISVSSGSSGVPSYWPRGSLLEIETTYVQEVYLKSIFEIDKYKTLYVNAFAMGMYIAGPIILNSALRVAQKDYPMTIITPGLDLDETLQAIRDLAANYDQIILAGYPPFLKDIVDEGVEQDFDWTKYRVRFLLAGEGFNESWREYLANKAGQSELTCDFINIYGTADASIVGHETPTSIAIRRLAAENDNIFSKFFPEETNGRLPTFVQYYPTLKFFEDIDNELIFTSAAGIPLLRYNIHDFGGLISFKQALKKTGHNETQLKKQMNKYNCSSQLWRLPFVYLYGKSDRTVTLYGLNIYPENIKLSLEDPEICDYITGRFTMLTKYHKQTNNQYLQINIELRRHSKSSRELVRNITNITIKTLRSINAEYSKLYNSIGAGRSEPVIVLCQHKDPKHFTRGIKHRWTNK